VNSTCPSELTLSMHADRELPADDAVATELHVATCVQCRARLAGLRSETSIVAAALAHGDEVLVVPAYRRPVSRLAMAATAAGGMFVAVLVGVAPDLIGGLLQGPVGWFNPFDVGTFANLGVETAVFLAKHGAEVMTSIAKAALMAALTTLVGWVAFARRRRVRAPVVLAALLGVLVMQPLPSHALDIRHDEKGINIPAGETIDDTLIVFGESVEIDGDVAGDVIAVGSRVSIRGRVGGGVFTAAESVTIDGEVGGSVLGLVSETLAITSPRIAGNLYGAGSTIDVDRRAKIDQNAVVAGERVQLAGSVGRDVLAGAEDVEVSGSIGGQLTAYAEQIALRAPAHIGGDVNAHVSSADQLSVAPGAVIGGELKTTLRTPHEETNEYRKGDYYLFQLLRFAAAFLTGVIVLALVPGLQRVAIHRAGDALLAGGVGLVTLVATPIIAVLIAITLIGLPIGLFALLLWMAGVYLAKVVLAQFIGARILQAPATPRHYTITLGVGLALVIVLVNLPFIGGLLNFVMTVLGLGMLVLFGWRLYRGAEAAGD